MLLTIQISYHKIENPQIEGLCGEKNSTGAATAALSAKVLAIQHDNSSLNPGTDKRRELTFAVVLDLYIQAGVHNSDIVNRQTNKQIVNIKYLETRMPLHFK